MRNPCSNHVLHNAPKIVIYQVKKAKNNSTCYTTIKSVGDLKGFTGKKKKKCKLPHDLPITKSMVLKFASCIEADNS